MIRGAWGFVGLTALLAVVLLYIIARDVLLGRTEDLLIGIVAVLAMVAFPLLMLWGVMRLMKSENGNVDEKELMLGKYNLWRAWLEQQKAARAHQEERNAQR